MLSPFGTPFQFYLKGTYLKKKKISMKCVEFQPRRVTYDHTSIRLIWEQQMRLAGADRVCDDTADLLVSFLPAATSVNGVR